MFIYFSNQACLEHVMAIFYNPQKDPFNSLLNAPIKNDLTPCSKGICGQQSNFQFDF
jgi:hypothetical protein